MSMPTKFDGLQALAQGPQSAGGSGETTKRSYKAHRKPQSEEPYHAKPRKCLMCSSDFPSTWPGERVCRRCKESATWRAG